MYSVEQVNVPPELGTIMKQYTKAVLRDKPQDVYKYSANFFALLSGRPAPFDQEGQLAEDALSVPNDTAINSQQFSSEKENVLVENDIEAVSEYEAIGAIFSKYDSSGDGFLQVEDLHPLLMEIKDVLGLNEDDLPSIEEVVELLHAENDAIDLVELRQLLFEGE